MDHIKKKLIESSSYVSLGNIIFSLGNFLFWVIFGKLLKISDIGYVVTALSLAFTLSTFGNLGLNYVVLRDVQKNKTLLSTIIIIYTFLSIVLGFIPYFFRNLYPGFEKYIFIITPFIFISLLNNILSTALIGLLMYKFYFLTRLFMVFSKIFLGLIFLYFNSIGLIIAIVLSSLLTIFILIFILKEYVFVKPEIRAIPSVLRQGLSNYPLVISSSLIINFSTFVASVLTRNPEVVGILYFYFMFLLVLEILPNAFAISSLPLSVKENSNFIKYGYKYGVAISLPILLFSILIGKYLISLIKPIFSTYYDLFLILSLAIVFDTTITFSISWLNVEKKLKEIFAIGISKILIFLLFSVVLKNIFGIVISYLISSLITSLFSIKFIKMLKEFLIFSILHVFFVLLALLLKLSVICLLFPFIEFFVLYSLRFITKELIFSLPIISSLLKSK